MNRVESEDPGVILLGGAFFTVSAAESLGRHNIPVTVLSGGFSPLKYSRFVPSVINHPAFTQPHPDFFERQKDALLQLARDRQLKGSVLMPTTDAHVEMLGYYHDELLQEYIVASPNYEVSQTVLNKKNTNKKALENGLAIPNTYYPGSFDELKELKIEFPAIVKPAISHRFRKANLKAIRADNQQQLQEGYQKATEFLKPEEIMVQELIPGEGNRQFSCAGVYKDGVPLASLVVQRSRQLPVDFGIASTLVQTVDNPVISQNTFKFMGSLNYTGIAETEFKVDPSGLPRLLDINTRTWAWFALGRRAGVDFPYLSYLAHTDREVPKVEGRTGISWIQEVNDVRALREMGYSIKDMARTYMKLFRSPVEMAICHFSDPIPSVIELSQLTQRYISAKTATTRV